MHKISDFLHRHSKPGAAQQHQQALGESGGGETTQGQPSTQTGGPFPSEHDLYCYRKQRGVNLGSWFVLERWITESPFRFALPPGQSDLDVAKGSYAKQSLERHWDTWITEEDWRWLAQHGVNAVRIPIGYYHLCGADPSVLTGTDFADLAVVFEGAWYRIQNALSLAHKYGLGVLLDLHAAPGKQNAESHSGTSASTPQFFTPANMAHTTRILTTLLTHLNPSTHPNLIGVELINEPAPGPHSASLKGWYRNTIQSLRDVNSWNANGGLPIYVGDCWQTDEYADFVSNSDFVFKNVVLDHHLYRCFTSEDVRTSISDHTRSLLDPNAITPSLFSRTSSKLSGAGHGGFVVGEWSGALNPGSLSSLPNGQRETELKARQKYISAQLNLYNKWCSGWFFWTYKKESKGEKDLGWSFRDVWGEGLIGRDQWVGGLVVRNGEERDGGRGNRKVIARGKALGEHSAYWDKYPGHYEHFRFSDGFCRGWDDMYDYFLTPISPTNRDCQGGECKEGIIVQELGLKGGWVALRVAQYLKGREGAEKYIWEFEHGMMQGIDAARKDFVQVYC